MRKIRFASVLAILPAIFVFVLAIDVRAEFRIVVPNDLRGDAGVKLGTADLADALGGANIVVPNKTETLPSGELIILTRISRHTGKNDIRVPLLACPAVPNATSCPTLLDKPAVAPFGEKCGLWLQSAVAAEGFIIKPVAGEDRKAVEIAADDARGLMYGASKLAERVRLGDDPLKVSLTSAPAFKRRMFSEQGQLLDIPDRNYYSDQPPFVNEKMLRAEIEEAKLLIDHVARLGYNTITFLHMNCEEYIDYKYLADADGPIYRPGDPHLARSPVFCRYMTELCDYAHARHMEIFLQLYEIQYPPEVDRRFGVDLDSPNIQRIILAKCRELFERVPLDGLVITPNETAPRCGYLSKHLWEKQGRRGAGKMLALYHNACSAVGKQAIFRLWRIAINAAETREALDFIPKDAMIQTKDAGHDYWLNLPITDIITSGLGREHPLMVTFDTFREYNGWSREFCYPQQWSERVKKCREGGVAAVEGWGAWSPGCIWADNDPGKLVNADGTPQRKDHFQGWAGYWNDYRMFTRGFTPGQANAYLLARLAWEPDAEPGAIARDFCALHLGRENAAAAAEAMMQTEQAWLEEYPGGRPREITHPCYMTWATIFCPRKDVDFMEEAYRNYPMEKMLASNARALGAVEAMERAFARAARDKSPDARKFDQFARGFELTALHLRSLYLYREYWWRTRAERDLTGAAKSENAAARKTVKAELEKLMDQWKKHPQEAAMWRFTYRHAGEPEIYRRNTYPVWFRRGHDTTMEGMIHDDKL